MNHYAVNAYARVDLTSGINSASPQKLITMLYNGGLKAIRSAQKQIKNHQIAEKGENISKAIAIIGELNASLNHDVEGEIVRNLSALYGYITRHLVHANLKNDLASLQEVEELLSSLRDAWAEVEKTPEETLEVAPA